MTNIARFIVISILLNLIISCGFKPIYSKDHQALPIKIVSITTNNQESGKLEFVMRRALESAINPLNIHIQPTKYNISVIIHKNILDYYTQHNTVNTRKRIDLIANFVVTNVEGAELSKGRVEASDSFEITVSPYSTLISDEETTNLLAKTLAEEIALRLSDLV